ncbi:MAG: hydrolase, partial [Flavobacteriaceae bacterium]
MAIISRYYLFFTFLFGFFSILSAQNEERSVFVKKIDKSIQIDGKLDEAIWSEAESANDFWQIFPIDSVKANVKTSVKVLYNNEFLFFGIEALSDDPNFIVSSLKRDFSARNND